MHARPTARRHFEGVVPRVIACVDCSVSTVDEQRCKIRDRDLVDYTAPRTRLARAPTKDGHMTITRLSRRQLLQAVGAAAAGAPLSALAQGRCMLTFGS